jgi:membrane protease subunit HflK
MLVSFLKRIGLRFAPNSSKKGSSAADEILDGIKNAEGPPDLEKLWRDFNQKLNAWLNQNTSNNSSGDGFQPESAGAKIGLGVIVAIVVFVWVVSGIFIVQEGQTAVVTTFGKYSHSTSSGINWRWPYPVQAHEIVNVSQVNKVEIGYRTNVKNKMPKEALMLTDDENIIDIQFAVQYKLKSAPEWLFNNREQEDTIRQVAETAIREIVGKSKMDFVLYEGREKVALDVNTLMQQILDRYKAGVQITNVTMQGVQPPEQVQAAFDDAVKAGQDLERQKNEGQAYANNVIPKARGNAARLLEESEAYKASVIANADGNASRFKQILVEYQKAPAVTRDRMYLDTMQQIFSSTSKLMMDTKNGNNMIYLPLEKLLAQTTADAKVDGAAKPAAQVPATGSQMQDAIPTVELHYSREDRARDSRERDVR